MICLTRSLKQSKNRPKRERSATGRSSSLILDKSSVSAPARPVPKRSEGRIMIKRLFLVLGMLGAISLYASAIAQEKSVPSAPAPAAVPTAPAPAAAAAAPAAPGATPAAPAAPTKPELVDTSKI